MKEEVSETRPESQQDTPQPFSAVLDLCDEYGELEVLQSISDLTLFDAEDGEDMCDACRQKAKWLHEELEALIQRAAGYFSLVDGGAA
jgi:hypothetical protein